VRLRIPHSVKHLKKHALNEAFKDHALSISHSARVSTPWGRYLPQMSGWVCGRWWGRYVPEAHEVSCGGLMEVASSRGRYRCRWWGLMWYISSHHLEVDIYHMRPHHLHEVDIYHTLNQTSKKHALNESCQDDALFVSWLNESSQCSWFKELHPSMTLSALSRLSRLSRLNKSSQHSWLIAR